MTANPYVGLQMAFSNWDSSDFAYFEALCSVKARNTGDVEWQNYALAFCLAKDWKREQEPPGPRGGPASFIDGAAD